MKSFGNLFDKETVERISSLVEDKMYVLNNVKDFHKKDEQFALLLDEFEDSLSDELDEKFDDLMRVNYQINSYYFTLAYFLGKQHGEAFGDGDFWTH